MKDYYICMNCGRIEQDIVGPNPCDSCGGGMTRLNNEEVEAYRKKIFNKKLRELG